LAGPVRWRTVKPSGTTDKLQVANMSGPMIDGE
jgi:hypothetical protein